VDPWQIVGAIIAGVALSIVAAALTAWVTIKKLEEWRTIVDKRLDRHSARMEPLGVMQETIKNNEQRLENLHYWKNNQIDERFATQYTNIVTPIERRLGWIEAHVEKLHQENKARFGEQDQVLEEIRRMISHDIRDLVHALDLKIVLFAREQGVKLPSARSMPEV
jgi:hypothetical protein